MRTYELDAVAGGGEVLEGVEGVGGDFVLHAAVAEAAFGSLVAEVLDGRIEINIAQGQLN